MATYAVVGRLTRLTARASSVVGRTSSSASSCDRLGEGVVPAASVRMAAHDVQSAQHAVRRRHPPHVVDGAEPADGRGEGPDQAPAVLLEHRRHLRHRLREQGVFAAHKLDLHVQVDRCVRRS